MLLIFLIVTIALGDFSIAFNDALSQNQPTFSFVSGVASRVRLDIRIDPLLGKAFGKNELTPQSGATIVNIRVERTCNNPCADGRIFIFTPPVTGINIDVFDCAFSNGDRSVSCYINKNGVNAGEIISMEVGYLDISNECYCIPSECMINFAGGIQGSVETFPSNACNGDCIARAFNTTITLGCILGTE